MKLYKEKKESGYFKLFKVENLNRGIFNEGATLAICKNSWTGSIYYKYGYNYYDKLYQSYSRFYPYHPFHIVDESPWPVVVSLQCLGPFIGMVMYLHGYIKGGTIFLLSFVSLLLTVSLWFRDILREGSMGYHTMKVQRGLKMGMILFIVSEIMFFFSLFWAFFHSSIAPTVWIWLSWPPPGVEPPNAYAIPFLNTVVLLASGVSLTVCEVGVRMRNKGIARKFLRLTILLGLYFTGLQVYEYTVSTFSMSDGIYGTTFFLTTGFHGFHVLAGTTFLYVCLIRLSKTQFSSVHHVGLTCAAWYWHFVDIVWLFVYSWLYLWGEWLVY